jgi:hypothetical protein
MSLERGQVVNGAGILIVFGLGGLLLVLMARKSLAATQTTAVIKAPTTKKAGSVSVTIPKVTVGPELTPPQVITIPETTITAGPANDSLLLTADETAWLVNGTPDEIYGHAVDSSHPAFVAAAGLALAGKGDSRALEVSQLATQFWKVESWIPY